MAFLGYGLWPFFPPDTVLLSVLIHMLTFHYKAHAQNSKTTYLTRNSIRSPVILRNSLSSPPFSILHVLMNRKQCLSRGPAQKQKVNLDSLFLVTHSMLETTDLVS